MEASSRSIIRAQQAQARWLVQAGDIFRAGPHLVACGDSRDAELVQSLLDEFPNRSALILCMDPPYCSGGFTEAARIQGTWGGITNDNLSSTGFTELIAGVLRAIQPNVAYVFCDWRMSTHLGRTMEACGLPLRSTIVWDKKTPGLGNLWRTQHEFILYSSSRTFKARRGAGTTGNIVSCKRTLNTNHPTEKPIALLTTLLHKETLGITSSPSDLIIDGMMGSGGTLLAADQVGLSAVGIEIEPNWVASALDRLAEAGHEVKRICTSDRLKVRCPTCFAAQVVSTSKTLHECASCGAGFEAQYSWRPRLLQLRPVPLSAPDNGPTAQDR